MSSDTGSNEGTLESLEGVNYETPLSTPRSSPPLASSITHDTSRTKYHMKDLQSFAESLETSAKRAFPNRGRSTTRYKNVEVLLLRWDEDDLGVAWEVEDLEKTFISYGFNAETWLIPSENAHLKLMLKAGTFVEAHESTDTLFIVYYGGHATINRRRQSTWSCKRDLRYATLEWSAIQIVFEKAKSDVLLLLDCCSAASAAPIAGRAITETIAACGWESIAAEPGRFSFTDTLIKVLQEWINRPFTAAMLHCEMLSQLKHENPELMGNQRVEIRRTPIYIVTTGDLGASSICLAKIQPSLERDAVEGLTPNFPQGEASSQGTEVIGTASGLSAEGALKTPHVLISLALEENQILDADACSRWLASFPALAKYAKVQSVFKSHSTLLLVSLPVMIWDLLPEDPACSFIGFVCSDNLLATPPAKEEADAEVISEKRHPGPDLPAYNSTFQDTVASLRAGNTKTTTPWLPWPQGTNTSGKAWPEQSVEISQQHPKMAPNPLPLLILPEVLYKRGMSHDASPFHSSAAGSIYSNTSSDGPQHNRLWAPSRSTSISTMTDRSTPLSMSHWSPVGIVSSPQDCRSPSFETTFEFHEDLNSSPHTATPKTADQVIGTPKVSFDQYPHVTADIDSNSEQSDPQLGKSRQDQSWKPISTMPFGGQSHSPSTASRQEDSHRRIHISSPHAIGWTVRMQFDPERYESWISTKVVEELKLPVRSSMAGQIFGTDGLFNTTVEARWYDPSNTPSCQHDSTFHVAPMHGPFEVIFGRKLMSIFGEDQARVRSGSVQTIEQQVHRFVQDPRFKDDTEDL